MPDLSAVAGNIVVAALDGCEARHRTARKITVMQQPVDNIDRQSGDLVVRAGMTAKQPAGGTEQQSGQHDQIP